MATSWKAALCALALSALVAGATQPLLAAPPVGKADRILVLKSKRELLLLRGGKILKTYPIALGADPIGPKHEDGDERTPEGLYTIDGRRAVTPYHLALHISYPNAADEAWAAKRHVSPGGEIFIHGMPERFGHTDPVRFFVDWTNGCISVGNVAIEEIWNAVDDGTPIDIRP